MGLAVMGLPKMALSARAGSAPEHVRQGLTRVRAGQQQNMMETNKVGFGVSAENHILRATTHGRRVPMFGVVVVCCGLIGVANNQQTCLWFPLLTLPRERINSVILGSLCYSQPGKRHPFVGEGESKATSFCIATRVRSIASLD